MHVAACRSALFVSDRHTNIPRCVITYGSLHVIRNDQSTHTHARVKWLPWISIISVGLSYTFVVPNVLSHEWPNRDEHRFLSKIFGIQQQQQQRVYNSMKMWCRSYVTHMSSNFLCIVRVGTSVENSEHFIAYRAREEEGSIETEIICASYAWVENCPGVPNKPNIQKTIASVQFFFRFESLSWEENRFFYMSSPSSSSSFALRRRNIVYQTNKTTANEQTTQ